MSDIKWRPDSVVGMAALELIPSSQIPVLFRDLKHEVQSALIAHDQTRGLDPEKLVEWAEDNLDDFDLAHLQNAIETNKFDLSPTVDESLKNQLGAMKNAAGHVFRAAVSTQVNITQKMPELSKALDELAKALGME